MTATYDELLQAVRAAPDDLGPRMVLADWLQDRGEPRGELIAAQCSLAGRGLDPATRGRLQKRVGELMQNHSARWAKPALDLGARASEVEFRKGFVFAVKAPIDRVLGGWQSLIQVEPVVRLELTRADADSVERLARSGILADITQLILRGDIGDDGAAALADCPDLVHLERLNLKSAGLSGAGVERLARAAEFRPLRLTLTDNQIEDVGARAIAESPIGSALECLYLSRTSITDDGVAALAGSVHLRKLHTLALGGLEELTDEGAHALAESPYLTSLRYLEVDVCYELSEEGVAELKTRFPRVRADYR